MRVRAFLLSCLPVPLLLCGISGASPAERKRPYEIPERTFETGLYLTYQHRISGVAELGAYVPLKWTWFHSDSVDWKFEGALTYVPKPGDAWKSAVAAPGFRYWIDGTTNVTPFVRLGIAHAQAGDRAFLAHGADVLLQKTFTLNPDAPYYEHGFAILEAQAGYLAHEGIGRRGAGSSARYGFVHAGASYDWPVWRGSWDGSHRKRAKLTLGVETYFGSGRPAGGFLVAALSIRSESTAMGRLIRKVDLSVGTDAKRRHRFTLGLSHGF